jgi:hypothetical protein
LKPPEEVENLTKFLEGFLGLLRRNGIQ